MSVEGLDDLGKVRKGTCEPIDLIDQDRIDPSGIDVGKQALESGAFHGAAGIGAIIISRLDHGRAQIDPEAVGQVFDVKNADVEI